MKHSEKNYVMGISSNIGMNPLFRSESFGYYYDDNYYPVPAEHKYYTMMEKRQLFLRSYQFHRKRSLSERIKGSLFRAKKVLWLRLRSASRLRRMVFSMFRLKCRFHYHYYRRRTWFSRLHNKYRRSSSDSNSSSCFC